MDGPYRGQRESESESGMREKERDRVGRGLWY